MKFFAILTSLVASGSIVVGSPLGLPLSSPLEIIIRPMCMNLGEVSLATQHTRVDTDRKPDRGAIGLTGVVTRTAVPEERTGGDVYSDGLLGLRSY
ncbi:unnamed protein product [Rhizoctonia solani]|uniref:Secreted protein n=1 Tax=Rhizoctonia solani TaxID=456999 RepID=A0A8H3HG51_9AGAM|nr:unnamed protein product [Rhizoctonia solani]